MIVVESKLKLSKEGYFEINMPIEYPDFDTQGIMNNAHIATLIETVCEDFLVNEGFERSIFSKCLQQYYIEFKRGISFKLNSAKQKFEPIIPMVRLKWQNSKTEGKINLQIVDSKNIINVFVTSQIVLNLNGTNIEEVTDLNLPYNTGILKFPMIKRSTNINRYGFFHLGRVATLLENTHLWFFGKGFLNTKWIRTPLPIIVKIINLKLFCPLIESIDLICLLRVENTTGSSSVKFIIDLVDKDNEKKVIGRANLVAVYVHPDPSDWTSAHTEAIPEQIRKLITGFYLGKLKPK